MPYGNDNTRLCGILRDIQQNRATIEFPDCRKQITVPNRYIHSSFQSVLNRKQELEIETWFLKKNRIIPLYDNPLKDQKIEFTK